MLFYKLSRQERIMRKEQKSLFRIQRAKNSAQLRNFKNMNLSENMPQIHSLTEQANYKSHEFVTNLSRICHVFVTRCHEFVTF